MQDEQDSSQTGDESPEEMGHPSGEVHEPMTPQPEAPMASMMDQLGAGERLLGLGAVIIVAVWLIFDLILEEYSFFTGTLLVAAMALFALWVRNYRPAAPWPLPYGWLLRVLGYTAAFLGALELLANLRLRVLDDPADIIGGLALYAGALIMFLGGRQMSDDASP